MLLLTIVLQVLLADLTQRDIDRLLEQRGDAVISSTNSATSGSELVVPDYDLDVGIVVYDEAGAPVAGTASASVEDRYADLARSTSERWVAVGESYRLLATPFTTRSGASGVVVVGERLAPYEDAEHYSLLASFITGLLATAVVVLVAWWVAGRALRTVAVLEETAADWSEDDLGQRFGLGAPTNELTELASVLDGLLDKVTSAIRSEQRLTSELAHELRTPLTAVQGAADLALLREGLPDPVREDLRQIALEARRMASTITALLELARTEASVLPLSSIALADVVADVVAESASRPGVVVHVEVADQRVAVPREVARRALAPVLANALRHAASRVTVTAPLVDTGLVAVVIEDDGAGVGGDVTAVFEPGTTSGEGSGAGLGLALARRMARSVGGDVLLTSAGQPTRFEVRLPRA
ncbi:two-component sensor histidine kinase [Nocardioides szechwanensis]|uniref:histidine kinase n=2 Tax=Nocardioides szechwanensis TaxID=1005944 RepID=A0A1H0KEW9_9ACTN|nr:two-component sensor histidine kinase [Nocardioides szechwanensis]SDO54508.1 Signal transduction histidine kinase [Nocardioides szechwanensis]